MEDFTFSAAVMQPILKQKRTDREMAAEFKRRQEEAARNALLRRQHYARSKAIDVKMVVESDEDDGPAVIGFDDL